MEQVHIEEVFLEFRELVIRSAFRMLRDHDAAEDVAQEVWLRLLESGEMPHRRSSTAAWLHVISTRAAIDYNRKQRQAERVALAQGLEAAVERSYVDERDNVVNQELLDRLGRVIALLPARQRAVVELRVGLELSVRATAKALSISEGTVKATLFQARSSIRRAIKCIPGVFDVQSE